MFPLINEDIFSVLYSEKQASRPNAPVNVTVSLLIIKEMMGLSDRALIEQATFNVLVRHALHVTGPLDPIECERTLNRFRKACMEHEQATGVDLMRECVLDLGRKLSDRMELTDKTRRADSMMIAANIRNLGRIELVYECESYLVKLLLKEDASSVPEDLRCYADPNNRNRMFYYQDPEEKSAGKRSW